MKWLVSVTSAVLLTGVLTTSCRIKEVNSPTSAAPMTPAVISTSAQGAQAVSQVNQAKELVYNSTTLFKTLGSAGIDVMVTDPTLASIATPVACADYGEYTYAGTVNAGVYSLTLTFDLCRIEGFQFDGTYTLTGTASNMTVTLGSSGAEFRIVDFNDNNYTAITGTLAMPGLRYTMAGTSTATSAAYAITSTGTITTFDYVMLGEFTVYLSKLAVVYDMSIDGTTSDKTTTVLANGKVTESWTGGSLILTYAGFSVSKVEYFSAAGPPPVYSGSDTIVAGPASFNFTPNSYGNEGIISVSTSTTSPISHDYSTGLTTAGTMTVSGSGSATAQFNAGGDIDITVAGDTPVSYTREYFLNSAVNFSGIEQAAPQLVGTTGSAPSLSASGSTWPVTMTVTALSAGPDLNCFTDVHVNYYTPLAPTTVAWYVDWEINLVNSCTPPAGIPFQEARDVNGNTTCDAGLDINGTDFDITSGGIEHFTATDLPVGYYVISVNNYSCDPATTNQVSIIIGDYLFGTYNCAYTSADGEGTDPNAWCRVADIQVTSGGTADVLAPDLTLNPWHP
jgi:hypothetical protein